MAGRVLLKASGEALGARGLQSESILALATEIALAADDASIGVVLGGGNLLRGRDLDLPFARRPVVDRMGMLATVVNALALAEALRHLGRPAEVHSALPMPGVAEPFRMERVRTALDEGVVVLLAGGTGHPYFTTDTAAALRALEIGADALLKATKVDGVYSADPAVDPTATRFSELSYDQVLEMRLAVMDLTAITLCRENRLPIHVFDMEAPGALRRVIRGEPVGTRVGP